MRFSAMQAKHANYACAALSLIILFVRMIVARHRKRPIDLSFFLVLLSIVVIISRITVVYYYLLFGTASDALSDQHYFDVHDYDSIKKGSILSLVARVLITASCWLQICLLLLFYSRMMYSIRWVAWMMNVTWVTTVGTFMAVVLATFLECRPLHLYWQIDPQPGKCVKGYVQIFLQCVSNILIDILLLIISYPILATCRNRSWKQHIRIGCLFTLGTFCIVVTTLRIVSVWDTKSAQPTRSLWASVQMVVSTFVANVPTIYGDLQVAKRKRTESVMRRASRPEIWLANSHENTFPGRLESSPTIQSPAPALTCETTRGSLASSSTTKEWFDHVEFPK